MTNFLTAISLIIFNWESASPFYKDPLIMSIFIVNGIFFIDMVANFIVIGLKQLWLSRRVIYLELFLQAYFFFILI